jgi:hypothetical protein
MDGLPDAVLSVAEVRPLRQHRTRDAHPAHRSGSDADHGAHRDAWADAFPAPGPEPGRLAGDAGKSAYLVPAFRRAGPHLEPP